MANLLETIKTGVEIPVSKIPVFDFSYHLLLAALCALLLAKFYSRYGSSISNRQKLAKNFLLITLTTTLVIAIVKSSLALSLGLVGALSIVRFRTAVKEPEELAYLFLSISLGLGFGANQAGITILAFVLILTILYITRQKQYQETNNSLLLNIIAQKKTNFELDQLLRQIKPYSQKIDIKRLTDEAKKLDAVFYIEFFNAKQMNQCLAKIRNLLPSATITLLDQSGIIL